MVSGLYCPIYCAGSIPNTIGSLTLIVTMPLYSNSLQGNLLHGLGISFLIIIVGSIPNTVGSLVLLTSLDLNSNKLTGAALVFLHKLC